MDAPAPPTCPRTDIDAPPPSAFSGIVRREEFIAKVPRPVSPSMRGAPSGTRSATSRPATAVAARSGGAPAVGCGDAQLTRALRPAGRAASSDQEHVLRRSEGEPLAVSCSPPSAHRRRLAAFVINKSVAYTAPPTVSHKKDARLRFTPPRARRCHHHAQVGHQDRARPAARGQGQPCRQRALRPRRGSVLKPTIFAALTLEAPGERSRTRFIR